MMWTACELFDEKKAREVFGNTILYILALKVATFCHVKKIQKAGPPICSAQWPGRTFRRTRASYVFRAAPILHRKQRRTVCPRKLWFM